MPKNKLKNIGIDARFYGPLGKGLGRYAQEIIDNIIKIDYQNKYTIFLSKDNFDQFKTNNQNVKKVLINIPWYGFKEQLFFPYYIKKARVDLMHFPHFNVPIFCPVKFIVTIHDLILTKYPTIRASTLSPFFYKIKNIGYKLTISSAIKRAEKIIAVSQYTKDDIIRYFHVDSEKISVTHEGVANLSKERDTLFDSDNNDTISLSGYNINKPYLLYVGNAYPHKNLERLVDVWQNITNKNKNFQLVLVGKEDYFYDRLKKYAASKNLYTDDKPTKIIFSGYVPDQILKILYQKALLFIFPSLYEGFGLPALEAMSRKLAVVSSNRASLPEILGEAALYLNPEDKDDMTKKITIAMEDANLRKKLIESGLKQVKKYSWWECANKTLTIYNSILTRRD